MPLDEACRAATREKVAIWCRDGMVSSRAGVRVSRIRDLVYGTNDTKTEEDFTLDPADWEANALGNLHGPHWQGGEAHFDWSENPVRDPGGYLLWYGGTLYHIQICRSDLDRMLATAPPKKRAGRPPGGGYRKSDRPLVEKMYADRESSEFLADYAAGMHYAGQAEGTGSLEAKARRLVKQLTALRRGELD